MSALNRRATQHGISAWPILVALALAAVACEPTTDTPNVPLAPGEWHEFTGSWNGAGNRRTIPLGADRRGSLVELRGSMLLSGPARPGVGFRSEVIALVDSETGLTGRSVWTDERGDQVFSELTADDGTPGARITGTILGGTGRFAGVTGAYHFTWHSLIETEGGAIQGRADDLEGRVRIGPSGEGDSKR